MSWFSGRSNGKYASANDSKPFARSESLIVEDLDDEVLIYDQTNARAHCLGRSAALVWRSCDGTQSVEELAESLELDRDIVIQALAELETNGLLVSGPVLGNGTTRREFSHRAVKVGVGVTVGSMVYSVVAPTAMASITPSTSQCLFYSGQSCDACSNICGCCCCCQGCSTATEPACKICLPSHTCGSFASGCKGVPGVSGSCSSGPHCSDTALDGPTCNTATVPFPPNGGDKCCYPPCVNGHPSTTVCGNGGQPCNCTGAGSACT